MPVVAVECFGLTIKTKERYSLTYEKNAKG